MPEQPAAPSRWPDGLIERGRAAGRLGTLARAAAAVQAAPDEDGACAAVGAALAALGLSGHLALVDAGGACLVVQAVVRPWSGLVEVEQLLGRPIVGARIDLSPETPYRAAMRAERAARVLESLAWASLSEPGLGRDPLGRVAALMGTGQVLLAPLTAGREVLGVLTAWAWALTEADLTTAEVLGRVAGGALAAQRARATGRRERAELLPPFAGA